MRISRSFTAFVSLFIALALVFTVWTPAFAQEEEPAAEPEGTTLAVDGNQGIFLPGGIAEDNVETDRVSLDRAFVGGVRITRSPMEFTLDTDGFMPFTYVYFNLWPWEARAWQNGDLQIFHKLSGGGWEVCPSFVVNGVQLNQDDEEDDNGSKAKTRIACVATSEGTYGIGTSNEDAVSDVLP